MNVYDCFLYFQEKDLLRIRLECLKDKVDYFVLTESTMTFSGKPKPLYFEENKHLFDDLTPSFFCSRHVVVRRITIKVHVKTFSDNRRNLHDVAFDQLRHQPYDAVSM